MSPFNVEEICDLTTAKTVVISHQKALYRFSPEVTGQIRFCSRPAGKSKAMRSGLWPTITSRCRHPQHGKREKKRRQAVFNLCAMNGYLHDMVAEREPPADDISGRKLLNTRNQGGTRTFCDVAPGLPRDGTGVPKGGRHPCRRGCLIPFFLIARMLWPSHADAASALPDESRGAARRPLPLR